MPAYAYPIRINRSKQVIQTPFTETLDQDSLTVEALERIAERSKFDIERNSHNEYEITVHACRLETDQEQAERIAKEEAYMKEYRQRHPKPLTSPQR